MKTRPLGPALRACRRAALLVAGATLALAASSHAQDADGQARAAALATCAAYYYNATNARPLGEYESLYAAGERAFNRALAIVPRAEVERLVGEAASGMTALTGGDWRNYHRVEARFSANCDTLLGFGRGDDLR